MLKNIIQIILAIFLAIIQISFLSQHLNFEIRLAIIFLIFSQIFNNQKIFFIQALSIGLVFDFFLFPLFFGFYSILFSLIAFLFEFLLLNVFTNRSFYSFLMLNFFGNLFYFFITNLDFDWEKWLIFDFWQAEIYSIFFNSILTLTIFLFINLFTKKLKPAFL